MSKNISILGVLLISSLGYAGCAVDDASDSSTEAAAEAIAQIPATGLTEEQLKTKVRKLSAADLEQNDSNRLTATRTALNPVIADLARIYTSVPVTQELEKGLSGTWRQLWTDDFRASPPGVPKVDPAAIYQVVAGTYIYNFSNQTIPTPPGAPKVVVSAFLRAQPTVTPMSASLDIQFTKLGILPSALPKGDAIGKLAADLESGVVGAGGPPAGAGGPPAGAGGPPAGAGGPPAGAGPVGIKGKLRNLYLDGDLRIVRGGTKEQSFNKVYILERVKP
jgi:hypothetical protein